MEIRTEKKGGVAIIYLEGNLLGENANAPVLDFIKSLIEEGSKKLVINLSSLKYINSTGLGMLISAQLRMKNAGGELIICHLPEIMSKLLKMMKLESTFHIAATEEDAITQLN